MGVAIAIHALLLALALGWPTAHVVIDAWRGIAAQAESPTHAIVAGDEPGLLTSRPGAARLARGLGVCLLIAGISAALSLPVAWAWRMRRPSVRSLVLLLAPMALPSYLSYTGWGTLRAPGTWLGDWLASLSPGRANVWPMLVGRAQAVLGLALFIWPIAALVQWLGLASIEPTVHESLRLEPMSSSRRVVATLRAARGAIAASVLLPALVMLGSAVPLHLAQIDTPAIALWRALDLSPSHEHWRVWLGAWPLVVTALAGAWWLSRWASPAIEPGALHADDRDDAPRGRLGHMSPAMLALLTASFAAPVLLHARSISGPRVVQEFLTLNRGAIAQSGLVGLMVFLASLVIGLGVWIASRDPGPARRCARMAIAAWLASALVPGVLVGVASARAWARGPAWVQDSPGVVALAHLARFGFVPALVGWWLAITEPRSLRDLAAIDGVSTLLSLWRAVILPRLGTIGVASLGAGILSFHEIESAVILQPPGSESFARTMLQNLHYARDEALAAGVLVVAGAVGMLWLAAKVSGHGMGRR
jgi:ABC-type spermidine/putrescine transport system permease subunit II